MELPPQVGTAAVICFAQCRRIFFKGTVSRDGYFAEGPNIFISTVLSAFALSVHKQKLLIIIIITNLQTNITLVAQSL
jgi:hypothetical protein